jgi:thiol-disulfide isomerase/thioredoxin
MKKHICWALLLCVFTAKAQTLPWKKLVFLDGGAPRVNATLTAIVFLSPDCPLCQGYTVTLNALQAQYAGILSIVGVFPGKGYPDSAYLAFKKKYGIRFLLCKDPYRLLVRRLHATTTPEVFLLDNARTLVYRGAIDDKAVSLGQQRLRPAHPYLALAISDYKAGTAVTFPRTEAVGCRIDDY